VQVKTENVGTNKVKLEITVGQDVFEKAMQNAYQKIKNRIAVPGFRKGKAPRKVVENHYGESVFYEEAINYVYNETYFAAVDEAKIEPVDRPDVDIIQIGGGQDFVYSAEVTVMPEVSLGQYKGIKLNEVEYVVSNEDVDNQIKNTQERTARWSEIDNRAVKQGDRVIIDYVGSVDGVEFEGGAAENYTLEIGSNSFIPGFEEQIIEMSKGDTKNLELAFPNEYHNASLAGKNAVFKVVLHDIKEKELPTLDDEFAKDVSEFDTFEEYSKDIRNKLEEDAKNKARTEKENNCVKTVCDNAKVEIPDVMVEAQVDQMVREVELQYRRYGMNIETYLEMTKSSMDDFRAQYKEGAYNRVKAQLVLEAIADTESIEVTEEDLNEEYMQLAAQYNKEVDEVKDTYKSSEPYLKNDLRLRKTVKMLMDEADVVTPQEGKEEVID